ncbi:glycosyltransferase family 4 protein [Glaciecola sp. SC05]|uniref:glycosyltransferase family 4 protein n=1 Tax=Glaciecola sp. SC05 TaxID=1987355 RepID=UPI0035280CD4
MKILYLINQYPKVSHTFIRREIQALEKHGVEVKRVAMRSDDFNEMSDIDKAEYKKTFYVLKVAPVALLKQLISTVISKPATFWVVLKIMFKMYRQSNQSLIKHIIYIVESCNVANYCNQHGITHIHAHFGTNPAEVAMYTGLLTSIPYSFTVHGPEEFDKPITLNLHEKIKHANAVFAITHFCKSQLCRWARFEDWNKIKLVHCGLEPSFFDDTIAAKDSRTKHLNFLCIGRLCEQKGQLLLLQAFNNFVKQGNPAYLTFAGDGEMRDQVAAYVSQHGLDKNVAITGWVDSNEIQSLLKSSDAMVLPSFAEGLPVAIMEAMAMGVAVISTSIAGIPELIVHRQTGLLICAGSQVAIEKALLEFSQLSSIEIVDMKQRAFNAVSTHHNIETEAAKIIKILKGAV